MKINAIKDIHHHKDILEVLVGIQLDAETISRWELEDPNVLVTYKASDKFYLDSMELIDRGIKVHGYELSEKDEDELSGFLEKKVLQKYN